MPQTSDTLFPGSSEGFGLLHEDIALSLLSKLPAFGEALVVTFGEKPASDALRALLVAADNLQEQAEFDALGWRRYVDEKSFPNSSIDAIEFTQFARDCAEYAAQGTAPRERFDEPADHADRERRIREICRNARWMRKAGSMLLGSEYDYIWDTVLAREAIDFGGFLKAEGIRLLSGVTAAAVRNAISQGDLHLDADGNIPSEEAKAWLVRRREFCPSRWMNLNDGQEPLDRARVTEPDEKGDILVPQNSDGTPFTPEHVVRTAKSSPGLSITIGAKGSEEQHSDFYGALTALAAMDVPRWRRRNSVGNWGIVRARGAWIAVSKAEIDRQLIGKSLEAV